LLAAASHARAAPVSFRNDIMAVLSKAGCNQGVCHGNQNGKNGFKLSLRGDDPELDWMALTHNTFGRRADRLDPAASLLLLKPGGKIPHEGGRRFSIDSLEYSLLSRWIAEGMQRDAVDTPRLAGITVTPSQCLSAAPDGHVQLHVEARFSDGGHRDVTRLAVYEPANLLAEVTHDGDVRRRQYGETTILVRYLDQRVGVPVGFLPPRPSFSWTSPPTSNYIDRVVFAKLEKLQIGPSPLCSDSIFIRRAFLDVTGLLPAADEVRAFLADSRPDKRSRLIDDLLKRPAFADFWALKWSDLLHNEEKVLDAKGVQVFHQWIRQSIADGKALNQFAGELIAARGSSYTNPPANYYRALRDPATRAEATAQVFLGIRLQCARCHNHPFDQWTQADYHGFAAWFARVRYTIVENRRKDKFDLHEFDGEQIVWEDRRGEVRHPRTGQAMTPRFLASRGPNPEISADRLAKLADWVADKNNPFFARTQANRVWYHLLGRGIVDPIDDFQAANPPINEPLLSALARDFADHNFDLRYLIRTIMNSRCYQLSAVANDGNRDDESNFSHAAIRPLQAEQLLDALVQVTGVPGRFAGYPAGMRSEQLPGVFASRRRGQSATSGERFLAQFGKPPRLLSCECERSDDTTLNQALQLLAGDVLNNMLRKDHNRLGQLLAAAKTDHEILQEFYLGALSRYSHAEEERAISHLLAGARDRRQAWEDILWGIVNSKEFLLRQ
jgi:hypothetical protein